MCVLCYTGFVVPRGTRARHNEHHAKGTPRMVRNAAIGTNAIIAKRKEVGIMAKKRKAAKKKTKKGGKKRRR